MLRVIYNLSENILINFQSLVLLLARLVIAYGILESIDSMGIAFPILDNYILRAIEIVGVIFLALGLFIRLVSISMILIVFVEIIRVHLDNGFFAGNNGFEIPLYYVLFLSIFATHGAGKFSFDFLLFKKDRYFGGFREFYLELSVLLNYFKSLVLLFARLVVAYGFYNPALLKWINFDTTVEWFNTLGIPFAYGATFLVASIEIIGVALLSLGLFTRIIAFPLIFIMLVAIITVHIGNGFSVVNNGFEIPLYYIFFLSIFASYGAGRFSIDNLISNKEK